MAPLLARSCGWFNFIHGYLLNRLQSSYGRNTWMPLLVAPMQATRSVLLTYLRGALISPRAWQQEPQFWRLVYFFSPQACGRRLFFWEIFAVRSFPAFSSSVSASGNRPFSSSASMWLSLASTWRTGRSVHLAKIEKSNTSSIQSWIQIWREINCTLKCWCKNWEIKYLIWSTANYNKWRVFVNAICKCCDVMSACFQHLINYIIVTDCIAVRISAPYTRWTFVSYLFVVKFVMCVWKDENKWKRGWVGPFF